MTRRRISFTVAAFCLIIAVKFGPASGGQIFNDTFDDGNADFPEAQWTPNAALCPGDYDASSGDYVLTATTESSEFLVSNALDHSLTDTSIRSQVRVTDVAGSAGFDVRNQSLADSLNYLCGIGFFPEYGGSIMFLGRNDSGGGRVFFGDYPVLPFDVRNEDTIVQLDVIGNKLELWAWRAGDPMPDQPQLEATDDTYSEGWINIFSGTGSDNRGVGTFRFVQLWDEHIVSNIMLGDVNHDGQVNGLDVDPFVEVLLTGPYQSEADMNEDQVVNGLDVDPFVAAVVGGGAQQIPEPSTLLLCLVALVVVGGWRKWRG